MPATITRSASRNRNRTLAVLGPNYNVPTSSLGPRLNQDLSWNDVGRTYPRVGGVVGGQIDPRSLYDPRYDAEGNMQAGYRGAMPASGPTFNLNGPEAFSQQSANAPGRAAQPQLNVPPPRLQISPPSLWGKRIDSTLHPLPTVSGGDMLLPGGRKPQTPEGRAALRSRALAPFIGSMADVQKRNMDAFGSGTPVDRIPWAGMIGTGEDSGVYTPDERAQLGANKSAAQERKAAKQEELQLRRDKLEAKASGAPVSQVRLLRLGQKASPLDVAMGAGPQAATYHPDAMKMQENIAWLNALAGAFQNNEMTPAVMEKIMGMRPSGGQQQGPQLGGPTSPLKSAQDKITDPEDLENFTKAVKYGTQGINGGPYLEKALAIGVRHGIPESDIFALFGIKSPAGFGMPKQPSPRQDWFIKSLSGTGMGLGLY